MLDFGSSDGHSNRIRFVDDNNLDNADWYVTAMFFELLAVIGSQRFWAGKNAATGSGDPGWILSMNVSEQFLVRHTDNVGGSTDSSASSTPLTVDSTVHSVVIAHSDADSYVRFYLDGVLDIERSLTSEIGANAHGLRFGSITTSTGVACKLGQMMVWAGQGFSAFSRDDLDGLAAQFHAGQIVPSPNNLRYWVKGDTATTIINEITGEVATKDNTVNFTSNAVDAYFQPQIEQWRLVGSHRLLRRKTEEQVYTLKVPLEHSNVELMDIINVSHDSLPLSATRLNNLGQLDQNWRRFISRAIYREEIPSERTLLLKFKDHESFMAAYWSTDQLPAGTSVGHEGLARLDVGTTLTVSRANRGYLEQENNVKIETSQNSEGQFYRTVNVGSEKINHIGFLAEDATDNPILNNSAKNGETSWTSTANGGTLDLSNLRIAYPSSVTGQSWRFVRTNNSNDTYRTQTFAVLLADAFRRIYVTKSEENNSTVLSWRLQRSSDSNYWNNTTGGWQVPSVWNALSNSYNASDGLSIITREISKPIDVSSNQNWTLDMGLNGAQLPAGGGEGNIYSISALRGKLRFSEVPTVGASITTAADVVKRVKTSGSQIIPATRGTLTFEMEAIQDGNDLANGDELCLYYWQYGASAGQDYDAVIYEKQSGSNVRFSFVRVISGTQDAIATKEVTIVPGTTYKIACVWTDNTNGELGAANSLMRIIIDGVAGTDDNASANHSAAATHTELWIGCAPSATGYRNNMNYTRLTRFWPRAFTTEEAPA